MHPDTPSALPVEIATFYKFVRLPDPAAAAACAYDACETAGVVGTVLFADEGVNGTVAGSQDAVDAAILALRADPRLADLDCRRSRSGAMPFKRLKVKTRGEIVTLGIAGVDPVLGTGTHVPPDRWNALIRRDDVVVIDTRNDYEVAIGSFAGACNPGISRFGELPGWIEDDSRLASRPPVAMFCTGGIRCEKSTAYLKARGFGEVYQLKGGILAYLAQVPESESLWRGECFVFDERVSVVHGLAAGNHRLCAGCGRPAPRDNDAPRCERCARAA